MTVSHADVHNTAQLVSGSLSLSLQLASLFDWLFVCI